MKKWEYKILRLVADHPSHEENLNSLGADGWELTTSGNTVSSNFGGNHQPLLLFFKREIPEPPTSKHEPKVVVERRVIGEDGKMRIESPEPPAQTEHPAFGTKCYLCREEIIGGEIVWDDHFREKHPGDKLPSEQFNEELDAGIHK